MTRALGIAKTIGSLLAIEMCVPGGTLIILALVLARRPGSPVLQAIGRRFPVLFRFVSGVTGGDPSMGDAAAGH